MSSTTCLATLLLLSISFLLVESSFPNLVVKFKFDATQQRYNATGGDSPVAAGNAGQDPQNMKISIGYMEFTPSKWTQLGNGTIVYSGKHTSVGGNDAIDFDQAVLGSNNDIIFTLPLSKVKAGTYEFVRTSVTYQSYDVKFTLNNITYPGASSPLQLSNQDGALSSFIGYNTYIRTIKPRNISTTVNANKLQGFWLFETLIDTTLAGNVNKVYQGQAPGTTVPNVLAGTSDIPSGSCVVTGVLNTPLVINGSETMDIIVTLSYSVNKSFEWKDYNSNEIWDLNAGNQTASEPVVDMGLRGLQASFVYSAPTGSASSLSLTYPSIFILGNILLILSLVL